MVRNTDNRSTHLDLECRKEEFNEFVGKPYYIHAETGVTSWTLPDEVRFYVEPDSLLPKVLNLP
jgi:hypothetical protein